MTCEIGRLPVLGNDGSHRPTRNTARRTEGGALALPANRVHARSR
jgi:hypothetical protein